ncbi:MAG: DNA repair protein RecN [Syntrophomonadaceae bacterium]
MLQEIFISNFVLIDELRMELSGGLNVLTGETGAGKSIIIDALGLIMGERLGNDVIRDASQKAVVEAVFTVEPNSEAMAFLLENQLIDENEPEVIISREISPGGRSGARVNGRNVTAGMLRKLSGYLIDMHLQHDHLAILKPEYYLKYVDSFSQGSEPILHKLQGIYRTLLEKEQKLQDLKEKQLDYSRKKDFLSYQIEEIKKVYLKPGEEEELLLLRQRIKNSQDLLEGSTTILNFLYTAERISAYDQISAAADVAAKLDQEGFFSTILPELEGMAYSLQDIANQVSSFRDSLEFEPGLLDEIEARLHLINSMKAKYGQSIEEILNYLEKAEEEIGILENSQFIQEELQSEIDELKHQYEMLAQALSAERQQGGAILGDKVNQELVQLNMPHLQFAVDIQKNEKPGPQGWDKVDFLFSPNPGEPMRSLAKVASGGEISRFVLALKKALAEVYQVPTLIFDEIDVGVGGTALNAVALKLYQLASSHQVILVTHSPQVAAYADTHYLIEKTTEKGTTFTYVKKLMGEDRVCELARMLGGENYSPVALKHARELIIKANS